MSKVQLIKWYPKAYRMQNQCHFLMLVNQIVTSHFEYLQHQPEL